MIGWPLRLRVGESRVCSATSRSIPPGRSSGRCGGGTTRRRGIEASADPGYPCGKLRDRRSLSRCVQVKQDGVVTVHTQSLRLTDEQLRLARLSAGAAAPPTSSPTAYRPASTWSAASRCSPPDRLRASPPRRGGSGSTAWSAAEREWSWDEFHELPFEAGAVRHPLRDEVVEARHELRRRVGRHAARGGRAARRLRDGVLARRLHDEPRARGPHRRQGVGRDRARGRAAAARARRPGAAARAAPLLLEEREVGRRGCG